MFARLYTIGLVCAIVSLSSVAVLAQGSQGQITGRVTDSAQFNQIAIANPMSTLRLAHSRCEPRPFGRATGGLCCLG